MIKEIATYTGGQPVYTKDLAFLQEAFKEAIICMNKSIGDTYILYGALSGSNVVEGAVVISGDVYKVTALGEIGNNKLCFRKKETSERTFRNSEKHKVYVDYEAYLSTDTSGSVAWIDLKTASRADDRISSLEHLIKKTMFYPYGMSGYRESIDEIINVLKEYKTVGVKDITPLLTENKAITVYEGTWRELDTGSNEFILELLYETSSKYVVTATSGTDSIYKGTGLIFITKDSNKAYLYGLYQTVQYL